MIKDCKISGFADEINGKFQVQLQVMKELGQKYVEFRTADGIGVADLTIPQALQYKAEMEKEGVKVSAVGSPIGKIGILEDFEPHFQKYCHVVELAKVFETPYIRTFSFYSPKDESIASYREEVMKRLERMVEYAVKHNVILLHENEKGIYGDVASRCKDLMEHFYGEHYQCTFDFANFVQCNQDTLEAYEMLKPYIRYIHVKDARVFDGEVVLAGDGDGNVKKIFHLLNQQDFQGYLSLEPHLTNFLGFSSLEKDAAKRKEENGIQAYKSAYHRLEELILESSNIS